MRRWRGNNTRRLGEGAGVVNIGGILKRETEVIEGEKERKKMTKEAH